MVSGLSNPPVNIVVPLISSLASHRTPIDIRLSIFASILAVS